jgi:catechol 2,3-dioxygenase-like lactoylglutathione lyase family enzyme
MTKLRHIAITVSDLQRESEFYQTVFGFTKHSENDTAISLSDGVMNVTAASSTAKRAPACMLR